ncbi:hypothetical protein VN0561_07720 [Helicobacter pylori]
MRFRFWLGVDLIYHYAKDLGNLKSPEENIQSSLGFFKDLLDLPVLENFKNIQLQSQFNNILSSNAKYLVHEYLNQSYESFDFAKLIAELSQAKLQFASPSHFARLLQPSYFLDKATLNKLNETSPIMQAEKELLKLSFIYVSKEISYKWKAMGKTFTMHQHVYEPIFEALKDHSMVSAQEIQDILSAHHKRKAAFNELVDAIVNLKTQGSLQAAQEKSAIEQAKHSSDRFNQAIIGENQYAYYLNHLVSPISAKGIYLNNLEMDFLYARMHHIKDPIKWLSQKPYIKQTEQELQNALQDFEKDLPRLKKLGVIPKETKK